MIKTRNFAKFLEFQFATLFCIYIVVNSLLFQRFGHELAIEMSRQVEQQSKQSKLNDEVVEVEGATQAAEDSQQTAGGKQHLWPKAPASKLCAIIIGDGN